MVLIELRKMYPGILTMQEQEKEVRAFSSMKNAVQWLKKNNFSYGRRPFFVYQGNSREWIHKNDVLWHFIQVIIYEYKMNDTRPSKFKNFTPRSAPWIENDGGKDSEIEKE